MTGVDLHGTGTDESGGVLSDVKLTVTRLETNLSRTTLTGSDGRYVIPARQPGT